MNIDGLPSFAGSIQPPAAAGQAPDAGRIAGGGTAKVINTAADDGVRTMDEGVKAYSQQRQSVEKGLYTAEGKAEALASLRQGNLIGAA